MLSPKVMTLLSVAKTLNFSRSAEELALTQPAVSQHIKALENELGTQIFSRSQKEPKLTESGRIAVEYARRMNELYQNLLSELEDDKNNIKRLTVGVAPAAESGYITQLLALYSKENPGLQIRVVTDTPANLYDKLRYNEVSLAIVEGSVPDPNFSSILLDTDYLVLAVSNMSRLAKKSLVTLDELKNEKLILRLPDSGSRLLFERSLASLGESLDHYHVILEVDNNDTIKDLVSGNFGVSVISKSACADYVRRGKLRVLPIENLSMIREINLIYHREFRHVHMLDEIASLYNDTIRRQGSVLEAI